MKKPLKILAFADLHLYDSKLDLKKQKQWIHDSCSKENPDVILFVGDIYESKYLDQVNPYIHLRKLCKVSTEIPIIAVLGNHEHYYKKVSDLHNRLTGLYDKTENVHYLDIVNFIDIGDIRFLGNVLWYDGSMKSIQNQDLNTFADGLWNDKLIGDFDFENECQKNIQLIKENLSDTKTNFLVTHMCPHDDINGHIVESKATGRFNPFNAFSGVKNLLGMAGIKGKITYAISGHTHYKVQKIIEGVECYNIGNDYSPPWRYEIIEI
jgi:predicted MPP superfamily phosphohydrolase